jgi:hypothetical protein
MPAPGQVVTTPGLPAGGHIFGDSGIAPNGAPLPADQGTDLEQAGYHYYAVVVPPGNGGLLSTELTAISGDPNLYLRYEAPPTLSHKALFTGQPLYDRALTNASGTETQLGRPERSCPDESGTWPLVSRGKRCGRLLGALPAESFRR